MNLRIATHLAPTLLLAAGLGVFAGPGQAQSATPQKNAPAKKSGGTAHKKSSRKTSRRERGQKAPTPERISEIQQALAKDGSFTAKPNGKWDDSTVDAMKRFQQTHGLNPSGKLDAKTLQQLGLGSATSGVAPPTPSNTSSKLTKPVAQSARRQ
ncbi:MAG TPA: peptidoglycan-binding domain-containing protein [Candidatus Angelobacter sp.]|nr:peptidoglycan-binding domain-containing protein [Candidatus Angelobacter sp.]